MLGTGHPGFFAAIGYPPNVVTQGLDMVTLFPLVRSLTIAPTGDWKTQPLLQTSATAWRETGDINAGSVEFDGKAIKGQRTNGATLTRQYQPADAVTEGNTTSTALALTGD